MRFKCAHLAQQITKEIVSSDWGVDYIFLFFNLCVALYIICPNARCRRVSKYDVILVYLNYCRLIRNEHGLSVARKSKTFCRPCRYPKNE